MKQLKAGIFWFTNDLRLHDNPALMRASLLVEELLCVYVIDRPWRLSSQYLKANNSQNSDQFLHESLIDLDKSLKNIGQRLIVFESDTVSTLSTLISQVDASCIVRSDNAGWYENRAWSDLRKTNIGVDFHSVGSHTLFDEGSLPFSIAELPASFTKFKHAMSDIEPLKPISKQGYLPPAPKIDFPDFNSSDEESSKSLFNGGETEGLAHMSAYFASEKPMFYKEVRNAIDGWDNSCKLSPWLANGCLSAREAISVLSDYEKNITANESTYWIYFELLWREYFQCMHIKMVRNCFLLRVLRAQIR